MRAYLDAMRRYADFKGRTSRSGFWIFIGSVFALSVAGWVLGAAFIPPSRQTGAGGGDMLSRVVLLVHLIPTYAIQVRRLHDVGRTGWWVLTGPVALIFFLRSSSPGPNRFGDGVGGVADGGHEGAGVDAHRLEQLEKLAALRAAGTIDAAEFDRMKASILTAKI